MVVHRDAHPKPLIVVEVITLTDKLILNSNQMSKIIKHSILSSGLHALQVRQPNGVVRVEIFNETQYEQFTWWNKMKLTFNLFTK